MVLLLLLLWLPSLLKWKWLILWIQVMWLFWKKKLAEGWGWRETVVMKIVYRGQGDGTMLSWESLTEGKGDRNILSWNILTEDWGEGSMPLQKIWLKSRVTGMTCHESQSSWGVIRLSVHLGRLYFHQKTSVEYTTCEPWLQECQLLEGHYFLSQDHNATHPD